MKPFMLFALVCTLVGCQMQNVQPANDGVILDALVGKRVAVLTALGAVDRNAYGGWDGDCPGTDVDFANAKLWFPRLGSAVVASQWNKDATGYRVLASWAAAAKALAAAGGGVLDIYYSGHGGQVKDADGDEADGLDETLCLWDGQLVDDVVGDFLASVPDTVTVNFWSDCCNAASNYRPAFSVNRIHSARRSRGQKPILCKVAHIGGCGDGKASLGGAGGGELSNAIWKSLTPGITWNRLRDACDKIMPKSQVPVVEFVNTDGDAVVY